MASADEISFQQQQLQTHRRNAAILVRQVTSYGGENDAPLHLLNQLDAERAQIGRVKAILRGWEVPVEDMPDDGPAGEQAAPPRPAGWRLVHPYAMPPNFTGRNEELALLGNWLDEPVRPLLLLRALGGFGKSALCWHWLERVVDRVRWPRVLWWSFYEGEASFDAFLEEALPYLGAAAQGLGPRQRIDKLLELLRQPGTLLLLDGFERELRAFSGMGAAYQGDAEGSGANDGYDCVRLHAEQFLRAAATLPDLRGKLLITSRVRPTALERHGELLQGCREHELGRLRPDDALAFFRAQGVQGERAAIERACERYGYHALSLRLLAGLVLNDPRTPGQIAAAERLDISGDLVQRKHHVLQQSYDALPLDHRQLLSRIACFRNTVAYETLAALAAPSSSAEPAQPRGLLGWLSGLFKRPAPTPRTGVSQTPPSIALDAALRDLVARSLLQHDRPARRFDLHPIVRRYAYDRLGETERRATHGAMRDYFAALPPPERVQQFDDLLTVIELYHHMVRAGEYDQAISLYQDRIWNPIYYQFGAYRAAIELLRGLFPEGDQRLPHLKSERHQAWALNELSEQLQPEWPVPPGIGFV